MSTENPTICAAVEYREIARFPGYRFGSDGSCWTRWKMFYLGWGQRSNSILTDEWTLVPGCFNAKGYRRVCLKTTDHLLGYPYYLHRLILEAFKGPCPPGLQCCHKPGVSKSSCDPNDLRWGTRKENAADRIEDGTDPSGERAPSGKLTWEKVDEIRRLRKQGMTYAAIAARHDVMPHAIGKICRHERWTRRPGWTASRACPETGE